MTGQAESQDGWKCGRMWCVVGIVCVCVCVCGAVVQCRFRNNQYEVCVWWVYIVHQSIITTQHDSTHH